MLNGNSKKFKAKVQEYFNKHRIDEFDANGDDIVRAYRAYTKNGSLRRQVNWVGFFPSVAICRLLHGIAGPAA